MGLSEQDLFQSPPQLYYDHMTSNGKYRRYSELMEI